MLKKHYLFLLVLTLTLGCSIDQINEGFGVDLTKEKAMEIAQEEVNAIKNGSKTYTWNESSQVVDAFPVYLDGIEGVSYYECKVETDGKEFKNVDGVLKSTTNKWVYAFNQKPVETTAGKYDAIRCSTYEI